MNQHERITRLEEAVRDADLKPHIALFANHDLASLESEINDWILLYQPERFRIDDVRYSCAMAEVDGDLGTLFTALILYSLPDGA